ncbi:MAG: deoxynucleoside kinase [bacterium]
MEDAHYHIAIEGPIGVGKTSLAMILAWELNMKAFFEPADNNPYLGDFYADIPRLSFPTQLYFLVDRFRKQLRLQNIKRGRSVVSDFYFKKDLIFASLNLNGRDKDLYDRIIAEMLPFVEEPNLIIYLDAPMSVLMERIRRRARHGEMLITEEYEELLSANYQKFFQDFQDAPLLPIDTTFLDFVNREADRKTVIKIVKEALK